MQFAGNFSRIPILLGSLYSCRNGKPVPDLARLAGDVKCIPLKRALRFSEVLKLSTRLLDPLPVGSVALTLKRTDPRNAGLVVEILAHLGPLPEWRIEDGYRVRRIDGQPIPSSITYALDGQIADANASGQFVVIQDRRYLQPMEQSGAMPSCIRFLRRPTGR